MMPKSKLHSSSLLLILLLGIISLPALAEGDYSSATGMTTKTINHPALENGRVLQDNCQNGNKLIDKMLSVVSDMNNYSANYHMTVYKNKDILREAGTIYFRKPKLFRVEVSAGPKKGALALLASDGKVHGHLGGALKYFQAAVSPDSSLVRAINGYPMVGSDFYSLVQYLKNMLKQGDGSLQTNQPVLAAQTNSLNYILDMYLPDNKISNNKNAKGPLLLKRIFVDPTTYLPVFWQDYTDGKLWSESDWYNVHKNLSLPDSLFKP